jgi:hypothetical protein
VSNASLVDNNARAWLILNPGGTVFDHRMVQFRSGNYTVDTIKKGVLKLPGCY